MNKRHLPYWFIVAAVFVIAVMGEFFAQGMFADGIIYSTIGRNLAVGLGSFFKPFFNPLWAEFYEHPPLVFWVQALFYKVLGDSFMVEKLYTMLTGLVTVFLMIKLWDLLFKKDDDIKQFKYIAILIWLLMPLISWIYRHNMLENTMGIFILLSVILYIKAFKNKKYNFIYLILAGISVVFAILCKGPVGLFPIVLPIIYGVIYKEKLWKIFSYTFIPGCIIFICFYSLMQFEGPREGLMKYFTGQVLASSIGSKNEIVSSLGRFLILKQLFNEALIVVFGFILIGIIVGYKNIKKAIGGYYKEILLMLFIGCSASLPIMLSYTQHSNYLAPSLVYYSFSGGIIFILAIKNYILNVDIQSKAYKYFTFVSLAVFLGCLIFIFTFIGRISRDQYILHDLHKIVTVVPRHTTLGVPENLPDNNNAYEMRAYYYRYGYVTVTEQNGSQNYILVPKNQNTPYKNYKKVQIENTKVFDLFRRVS